MHAAAQPSFHTRLKRIRKRPQATAVPCAGVGERRWLRWQLAGSGARGILRRGLQGVSATVQGALVAAICYAVVLFIATEYATPAILGLDRPQWALAMMVAVILSTALTELFVQLTPPFCVVQWIIWPILAEHLAAEALARYPALAEQMLGGAMTRIALAVPSPGETPYWMQALLAL